MDKQVSKYIERLESENEVLRSNLAMQAKEIDALKLAANSEPQTADSEANIELERLLVRLQVEQNFHQFYKMLTIMISLLSAGFISMTLLFAYL